MSAQLQNPLLKDLQPVCIAPPVSTAIQTLPLKQLPWAHFEQLCVRLALKDRIYIDARAFGVPGQDQLGIDLYAVDNMGRYSVWQCKRYQRFAPASILTATKEFLQGNWAQTAYQFRLCVTDDLTPTDHVLVIEQARELLNARGIQFVPMGVQELSAALKPHRDLVADFFGKAWSELFCVTAAGATATPDHTESGPDAVDEVLISNLMKVVAYPDNVWSAPTEARKDAEVFAVVPSPDAFVLRSEALFTFANLRNPQCLLRNVVDASRVGDAAIQEWLNDTIRTRWLVELLNRCLRQYLYTLGLKAAKGHRYFFKPNIDGSDRVLGDGKKAPKLAHRLEGFWVHRSATLQFKQLGQQFFLLIDPGFMFTTDGFNVIGGTSATRKAMQWGGRQQNDDILRSILFWTRLLAANGKEARIHAGADAITLRALPATGKLPWGIAHDHIHMASLMEAVDFDMEHVEEMIQEFAGNLEANEDEPGGEDESESDEGE